MAILMHVHILGRMTHSLVTPERAAEFREQLKKLFAERQVAKSNFAAMCMRIATEQRSSFGKFTLSFEEVAPDFEETGQITGVRSELRPER